MICSSGLRIQVIKILASSIFIFVSGCSSMVEDPVKMVSQERHWDIDYSEKLKVMTIPEGAQVYVEGTKTDYVGESPVEVELNSQFGVSQTGSYPSQHRMKSNWLWETVKLGDTNWNGSLSLRYIPSGQWTIKAFKDGYKNAEVVVPANNQQTQSEMRKAIKNMTVSPSGELPSGIIGENSILITLEPIGQSVSQPAQQQQPQQRQTNLSAQAEYEQALAVYNTALEERDNARVAQALPRAYPNPALGILVDIGAQQMVTEKERSLEIARQRLERAKAKINHSEW